MRLDLLLVEKGLADSRAKAQALIMARQVRVAGQVVERPAALFPAEAEISVERGAPFVSRGGEKLEAALQAFPVTVAGRVCADVGASTGGFTDCLLQRGAAQVYAIDVGKGLLHWKLRNDPRVVVMEEINARFVAVLPQAVGLVTIDASFISLRLLLPVVRGWFGAPGGEVIALVKPQFEAGRRESARHKGVIRDAQVHRAVLEEVLAHALEQGLALRGLLRSPVLGPKGNVEFLAWMTPGTESALDLPGAIEELF